MDRQPKLAPFKVGSRLRYIGTHESYTFDIDPKTGDRKTIPLLVPGIEVTVDKIVQGRQGTLRHLRDEDGPMYDDEGEPVLDRTQDSYSVYHVNAYQSGVKQGRIIWPDTKHEWERIK